MTTTNNHVYEFTKKLLTSCRNRGANDIAMQLDDAMHLGSSGLEILGEIRSILVAQRLRLEKVVSPQEIEEVVQFIERQFGGI